MSKGAKIYTTITAKLGKTRFVRTLKRAASFSLIFVRKANPWRRFLGRLMLGIVGGVLGLTISLGLSSYQTTIAGIDTHLTTNFSLHHQGLTVASSVGNIDFSEITRVPVRLTVTPTLDTATVQNLRVDDSFLHQAEMDMSTQIPQVIKYFVTRAVIGLLLGALIGVLLYRGLATLWRRRSRDDSTPKQIATLGLTVGCATIVVSGTLGIIGYASYSPTWVKDYQLSGILAEAKASPSIIKALDRRDTVASQYLNAVQSSLKLVTQYDDSTKALPSDSETAFNIMFISDVHRRNIYPYLEKYITANNVKLIINTGDETSIGQPAEINKDYIDAIERVTKLAPMLWTAGNHDTMAVAKKMAKIPGVYMLDDEKINAYGLSILAGTDPEAKMANGGPAEKNKRAQVNRDAAQRFLTKLPASDNYDIMMTHEPPYLDTIMKQLGQRVKLGVAGHTHHQNKINSIERPNGTIRLIEGTTGLGGVMRRYDPNNPVLMSFSIVSVTKHCEFSKIARYNLADPALTESNNDTQHSTVGFYNFDLAKKTPDRTCHTDKGMTRLPLIPPKEDKE